jgi:predicted PolB exonuclease-like 3'-5' exonuclease
MSATILSFDIETIPDLENARKIYDFPQSSPEDLWQMIRLQRLEKSGNDFLPHYLQKIIAISLVLQERDKIRIWTLGEEEESEQDIIQRFFAGLDKFQPTLVSWNGGGFDLPVLHYRSMIHNISAPIYWENGENFPAFKWNNYTGRYHQRHTDIMDVMANYQNRAFAPLDEFAQTLGLPGKIGLDGAEVYPAFLNGKLREICDYCEADVLNTHLIYLRFLWCKGLLSQNQYLQSLNTIEDYIHTHNLKNHWQAFLPYIEKQYQWLKTK